MILARETFVSRWCVLVQPMAEDAPWMGGASMTTAVWRLSNYKLIGEFPLWEGKIIIIIRTANLLPKNEYLVAPTGRSRSVTDMGDLESR